jgi:hypothetical protein
VMVVMLTHRILTCTKATEKRLRQIDLQSL